MASFETATFAGGCFWCTQHDFNELPGIILTTVGYIGGTAANPTYEQVCTGTTGHAEALQIIFDPKKISYKQLLKVYWRSIDPTRNDGQFCDIGTQYRPIIFYHSDEQKKEAEKSKEELSKKQTVLVDILPAKHFFQAEDYHQEFYKKNPVHYARYHQASGRNHK